MWSELFRPVLVLKQGQNEAEQFTPKFTPQFNPTFTPKFTPQSTPPNFNPTFTPKLIPKSTPPKFLQISSHNSFQNLETSCQFPERLWTNKLTNPSFDSLAPSAERRARALGIGIGTRRWAPATERTCPCAISSVV